MSSATTSGMRLILKNGGCVNSVDARNVLYEELVEFGKMSQALSCKNFKFGETIS